MSFYKDLTVKDQQIITEEKAQMMGRVNEEEIRLKVEQNALTEVETKMAPFGCTSLSMTRNGEKGEAH